MFPISSNNFVNNPYTVDYNQQKYWLNTHNQPAYNTAYGYYEQPSVNNADTAAKTVVMAGVLEAVSLGLKKASNWFSNKLAAGKEFTSAENVHRVADEMVRKNNLDVHVGYINDSNKYAYSKYYNLGNQLEEVARGKNAFFTDELKLAVAPSNKPSLILHELGHAINSKNVITKFLQNTRRYAHNAPAALLFANALLSDKNDGKKSFIERNAGILGFAAFLPTIIEEGLASFRGVKAAKKVLNNPAGLNILKKNYLLALSTYIIAGLGLGVAAKYTMLENSVNK